PQLPYSAPGRPITRPRVAEREPVRRQVASKISQTDPYFLPSSQAGLPQNVSPQLEFDPGYLPACGVRVLPLLGPPQPVKPGLVHSSFECFIVDTGHDCPFSELQT